MEKKTRILHVIDGLGMGGGAERQLLLNILNLDHVRFENLVCYLKPRHDLVEALYNNGVPIFYLGVKGKLHWLPSIYRLSRFIKSQKINLVHTSLFEADLLGGLAGKLSGIPVISTLTTTADDSLRIEHEINITRYKLFLTRNLTKIVQKLCCSYFIAISEYVKASWNKRLGIPKDRITVIPRAISPSWLQPVPDSQSTELSSELSLNDSYPVLLNVGRQVPAKGQKYLLKAMPDILKKFPKTRLLIAGEKSRSTGELERIRKEYGLEESVTFLGKSTQVRQLLQLCDIFIFPSIWEGFGTALLEAAATGKPCIASNAGPMREIIQHEQTGLLVNPGSPQDLAQAVLRMSANKEEAQILGRQARETVMKKFVIDVTIKTLEAVYARVLDQ